LNLLLIILKLMNLVAMRTVTEIDREMAAPARREMAVLAGREVAAPARREIAALRGGGPGYILLGAGLGTAFDGKLRGRENLPAGRRAACR
jgi:hypothetical protein